MPGLTMQPRISLISLGVTDIKRAVSFYADGLGLPRLDFPSDEVAFFTLHGTWLGLYGERPLAEDAGVPYKNTGGDFRGVALAHNLPDREQVDRLIQRAALAGATITKPAQATFWGGYSGYFSDPDGHLWEVAHNPFMWVGPAYREETPRLVADWRGASLPEKKQLTGDYCTLAPLSPERHGPSLYAAFAGDDLLWQYLPYGPYSSERHFMEDLADRLQNSHLLWYAVCVRGEALGVCSLMRIKPEAGSLEVGNICFSLPLQHSRCATEAIYMLGREVFRLGYRRFEWKCDAANAASRSAALRLGFSYEGIFRNAVVVKNRNRDTAWYAMTDDDWHRLAPVYRRWLAAENFTTDGKQRTRLSAQTRALLAQTG